LAQSRGKPRFGRAIFFGLGVFFQGFPTFFLTKKGGRGEKPKGNFYFPKRGARALYFFKRGSPPPKFLKLGGKTSRFFLFLWGFSMGQTIRKRGFWFPPPTFCFKGFKIFLLGNPRGDKKKLLGGGEGKKKKPRLLPV